MRISVQNIESMTVQSHISSKKNVHINEGHTIIGKDD